MSFDQKKQHKQILLVILIFIFLFYDYIAYIHTSLTTIRMPRNSEPIDVGDRSPNGSWGSPSSFTTDIADSYYPKSFGFWDASYQHQVAHYWLNSSGIVAIILCSLSIINLIIAFLFINRRIKSWFRLPLFNNTLLILSATLLVQLVLGLGDVPHHFNDPYNKGWQWFDDGRTLDVDWKNWLFGHDVKRDTTYGSEKDATYNKMYYFTTIGIVIMIFDFIIIVLTTIISLFGIILTISRYRSWKRYRHIDIDSVDIGLIQ